MIQFGSTNTLIQTMSPDRLRGHPLAKPSLGSANLFCVWRGLGAPGNLAD